MFNPIIDIFTALYAWSMTVMTVKNQMITPKLAHDYCGKLNLIPVADSMFATDV